MAQVKTFVVIGSELVDPSIPESRVEFEYTLWATSREQAADQFAVIFPSCVLERFV